MIIENDSACEYRCDRGWLPIKGTPDEVISVCSFCGSSDLQETRVEYPTGVVAPDGYREMWSDNLVECLGCGLRQEEVVEIPLLHASEFIPCFTCSQPEIGN